MACDADLLKRVPLFHCSMSRYINIHSHWSGDHGGSGYVVIEGGERVSLVDEDQQELVIHRPESGGFDGFSSLLDGQPHQTSASALSHAKCLEINSDDLRNLLLNKPAAGMDMLSAIGRQLHSTQRLVQMRSLRNVNEVIEERATFGDRLADAVARFGGAWRFIIAFGLILAVYTAIQVGLKGHAWDPYPFILLNLILSMLAAIQAPVIMMSQNRQDAKDRIRGELDYDVNRRAEMEIRALSQKVNKLADRVDDLRDDLRARS